mgnify:FL=1
MKLLFRIFFIIFYCSHGMAEINSSMIQLCQNIADGKAGIETFEKHPLAKKMKEGIKDMYRVSLQQVIDKKDELERIKKLVIPKIRKNWSTLINSAEEFLPQGSIGKNVKINFVCGGPWDAYVLVFEEPEIFLDVTKLRVDKVLNIIKHELWHVGYKKSFSSRWNKEYISSNSFTKLAYQVVNEGVGHYYSFQNRVEPVMMYEDWNKRIRLAFQLFSESFKKLKMEKSRTKQDEIIWSSHAGVPFWKKWSAVSGAIMIYYLKKNIGVEKTADLISKGSCATIVKYQEIAKNNSLNMFPRDFIKKACE